MNVGKFPFDKLLTFYEFEELHRAIQEVKEGKVIKPVLVNRTIPNPGFP
jgi:aryl-alcohol dehydrogenase